MPRRRSWLATCRKSDPVLLLASRAMEPLKLLGGMQSPRWILIGSLCIPMDTHIYIYINIFIYTYMYIYILDAFVPGTAYLRLCSSGVSADLNSAPQTELLHVLNSNVTNAGRTGRGSNFSRNTLAFHANQDADRYSKA